MSRVRIILFALLGLAVGAAALYTVLMPAPSPAPAAARTPDRPPSSAPSVTAPAPAAVEPPITKAPATPARPAPATTTEPAPVAAPSTATLRIESDVPDTSVFIDRVYLGTAPVTVPNLTPGSHRLNASAAGYDGIAETIEILAGERNILLQFRVIRLDVRVDVVHKHGVGSCTGTLSASPRGVTYATTHKDDGFDAPLGDITAIELDYLAKNLRLKLKSGKTYNFTETGGGADQLYAFHRDVDKVIKKKGH